MDSFGDLFGGVGDMLGEMFGGAANTESIMGLGELLAPEGRRRGAEFAPVVYERYLCGKPRELHINDR